jgi:hypothetical protein
MASQINAIRKRRDGWWDQRFTAGKRASNWFDLVDYLACEARAKGEELAELPKMPA